MSGLLADLYSAGDRMKRKLGGLLSNPLETIALGSQRMAEDTNALTRLVSEAGYMPNTVNRSDQSVLVSERQKALARALLADKGAEMGANMVGATVWHGSPHKFDKFDSSKIGTGEGAQAYGHGLYLAESPDVAKAYRDNLTKPRDPFVMVDDTVFSSPQTFKYGQGAGYAAYDLKPTVGALAKTGAFPESEFTGAQASGLIQEAIKARRSELLMQKGTKAQQALADLNDLEQILKIKPDAIKASTIRDWGSLYKVDLPDNAIARMLDWDRPLSQQAPEVQDALNKLPPEVKAHLGIGKYNDLKGGIDIVKPLGGLVGDAKVPPMLRQVGIPGIRYLDGGSRGAGQGTSNYVVFPGNEGLLQILERNGVPIK